MSIWGNIAKVAGYVGAPFTGGASIALGNTAGSAIDSLSKGLGASSQAMASNRGTKAEMMLDQNSALERELMARQNEMRTARNDAYANAIRGSMASNWQSPVGPPGVNVIRFGGPNGPANPQAKAVGAQLFNQAQSRLNQSDLASPSAMPAYRNLALDKDFQKTMNPGVMERIFGYGSALSPFLNFFNKDGAQPQAGNSAQYAYNPQSSVIK